MRVIATPSEGAQVEDFFPTLDEATLVGALTTTFDSPESFDALLTAANHPDPNGDIGLLDVNAGIESPARPAQQLTLVAFKDSPNGDQ